MPTLLHVTASPRGDHSISRKLGERYVSLWQAAHTGSTVIERNLMETGLPYMDIDWIGGVYAPPAVPRTQAMEQALALSAELIEEVRQADALLISTPMYNFSIPAILKSWLDYLVRPGFTFALAPGWPGLLADKPTRVLVATRDEHSANSPDDLVTPVIRRALAFMGIKDVESLLAGGSLGVNRGEIPVEMHLARFESAIRDLVVR